MRQDFVVVDVETANADTARVTRGGWPQSTPLRFAVAGHRDCQTDLQAR
jgi:hypothetical protein